MADVLLAPIAALAGPVIWLVRRMGMHRLPLCRALLVRMGLLPLRKHYYDPYVDASLLRKPLGAVRELPGLDLNEQGQLALLAQMNRTGEASRLGQDDKNGHGYKFGNGSFESGDAEFLYGFVRLKRPRRVIEIGSGHSTLLVRDALAANVADGSAPQVSHVCIEPFEMPWLEKAGVRTVRSLVENVPMSMFEELEAGDLLFIDSSHVIRPQGDVLTEYLDILPRLKSGVFVHIHDIFTPRDYPEEWILKRMWLWNEQYLVEAMLSHGSQWRVVAALNYLKHSHFERLHAVCPFLTPDREPGSLYLVKN